MRRARSTGSSPLARGLRRRPRHPVRGHRIIPARAGFTSACSWLRSSPRDHPRSRGVYVSTSGLNPRLTGSSPLARGLPYRPDRPPPKYRIIPARAGFTGGDPVPGVDGWDHPRSRGVYMSITDRVVRAGGSSPLARGLRCRCCGLEARAQDHPRSRGVYAPKPMSVIGGVGSSPLARGLRLPASRQRVDHGIIPARAGFTTTRLRTSSASADHPRSRGVYHRVRGRRPRIAGIIPARAGFTWSLMRRRWRVGDHPRSRGVYGTPRKETHMSTRIIPARAGFTSSHPSTTPGTPDHPRSRGVYSPPASPTTWRSGSSPLARGLLISTETHMPGIGIIPARAGFTRAQALLSGGTRDHPRSRGVYQCDC